MIAIYIQKESLFAFLEKSYKIVSRLSVENT